MKPIEKYVVLDAKVVISAILNPGGTAYQGLEKSLKQYHLIEPPRFGVELIAFAQKILTKMKKNFESDRISSLLKNLTRNHLLHFIEPVENRAICRDPKDNDYINLAIEYRAILVSGDQDILTLKDDLAQRYGIRVLTSDEFANHY